jgi:hypothetical protein
MHKTLVLFALSLAVCSCNRGEGQRQLKPLASGLAEAWQPVALDMRLDIYPEATGDQAKIRCVLRNVSTHEIVVDAESLPWHNEDYFSLSAVDADGKVIHQDPVPIPVEISRISAPKAPVAVAPGESIEGSVDMGYMHISKLRRDKDLLLLWSYDSLRDWNSEAHYFRLSGITLLKARSPATGFPTTRLETVSGTSVPTQQLKQDLRDAPETIAINDKVIRLLAIPWQERIRLISEHGTPLPLTLRVQAIWMLQDGQIWNGDAIEETVGESNGSSRDFLVHEGPNWESMTPVDVVIKLSDDKGATHMLAVRHKRIAAVE